MGSAGHEATRQYDRILLIAVMALLAGGIVMVYSASSVVALTVYNDSAFFMKRQILWLFIGLAVMGFAMRTDHEMLADRRVVAALLLLALLLAVLTFAPGVGKMINGARRWIKAGSLTFQPAEFVKLVVVVYLSAYIARKRERIRDIGAGLAPAFVVTGLFMGLVLLQPDFGTAVTLGLLLLLLLFAGGANIVHLGCVALAALPLAYAAVSGKEYRLKRVLSFLDPWADPQGAGHQIIQSYLAFGSGGIFGRGLGEGRQKLLFLPERHSDFIYAVIGEELGIIGAGAVVVLFTVILWRGLRIARLADEQFSRLLAFGITLLICIQALVNMLVVTGMLPTKGIALPFVSYGGSALVVSMAAMGVLLNISRRIR